MAANVISGEITPCPHQAARTAKTLQQIGFRILHIGATISVQGAQRLWESTFSMRFHPESKRTSADIGAESLYPRPDHDPVAIPGQLQGLIESIAIAEPPEWFDGSA